MSVPYRWPGGPCCEASSTRSVGGDPMLASNIASVDVPSAETAEQIRECIADYGETLVPLPEESWDSSVALWMNGFWEVLVDLWTEAEGRSSDLVLHMRVFEDGAGYRFEVGLVYVP